MRKRQKGFTIVELLIVIVVIAILAAITIVAYNGVQNRAADAKRASDMATIQKIISTYDTFHDGLPQTRSYLATTDLHNGWDASTNSTWLSFLKADNGTMPVDPVNTLTVSNNPPSTGNFVYYYYCYPAGSGPLPSTPNVSLGYHKSDGAEVRSNFAVSNCR